MAADEDRLHAPLHEFVARLCGAPEQPATGPGGRGDPGEPADPPGMMHICELGLDLPLELHTRTGPDGRLEIRASPPTQRTATTVLPVFHRLRVRIVAEDGPDAG